MIAGRDGLQPVAVGTEPLQVGRRVVRPVAVDVIYVKLGDVLRHKATPDADARCRDRRQVEGAPVAAAPALAARPAVLPHAARAPASKLAAGALTDRTQRAGGHAGPSA